jgi:hypothetical protein
MMAKIKASPTQFAGSFCITTNTKKKPHRGCGGAASEQRGAWGIARTWFYKSAGRKAFRKKAARVGHRSQRKDPANRAGPFPSKRRGDGACSFRIDKSPGRKPFQENWTCDPFVPNKARHL